MHILFAMDNSDCEIIKNTTFISGCCIEVYTKSWKTRKRTEKFEAGN